MVIKKRNITRLRDEFGVARALKARKEKEGEEKKAKFFIYCRPIDG